MTPRQRWAVAWRTVRIADGKSFGGIGRGYLLICACRGSGNTTGRRTKRAPLLLERSPRWFLILSRHSPCDYVRDDWVDVLRRNLQHSRADRESWEALP